MASVTISGLNKSFGALQVLHDISLEIADGEFLVLVGPSGCGKSTLLRTIAGLEEVSAGEIAIGAKKVNHLPPKMRDISMVFQNYALYPHLTVAENMGFSLTLAHAPAAEKKERVQRAAQILGLEDLLERKPRQLSGGQRQRVAMGRSIVRNPKVFLFDEPLSNLDAKLRVAMRTEIKALHQRLSNTAIYVTHDQAEAMTMADRIAVMNAGRIEQIGQPLELYDRPANVFVADFIGTPAMNMIEGQVDRSQQPAVVRFADSAQFPLPTGVDVADGARVIYGIRPEHCRLDAAGASARLEVIEPMGAATHLAVTFAAQQLTITVSDRPELEPGRQINFAPEPGKAVMFDAASGLRA